MARLGVARLGVDWIGVVQSRRFSNNTTQHDTTQQSRRGRLAAHCFLRQAIMRRIKPETATMDVPPERAELLASHELIKETIDVFLGAGMIEDTGERRKNRRGELEPVYRVVRKRRP